MVLFLTYLSTFFLRWDPIYLLTYLLIFFSGISSAILFDISFDNLFEIFCNISSVILSDISFDILYNISSDIFFDILSDFLSNIIIF